MAISILSSFTPISCLSLPPSLPPSLSPSIFSHFQGHCVRRSNRTVPTKRTASSTSTAPSVKNRSASSIAVPPARTACTRCARAVAGPTPTLHHPSYAVSATRNGASGVSNCTHIGLCMSLALVHTHGTASTKHMHEPGRCVSSQNCQKSSAIELHYSLMSPPPPLPHPPTPPPLHARGDCSS